MKDLQAVENIEHFIELALDRLDINSLDELELPKEKAKNSKCCKTKN